MESGDRPSRFQRLMIWLMPRMTQPHVWAYRKLGGRFVSRTTTGGPVLLVTTIGPRTGEKRTAALGY
jgi:F420H(2)-dependent quinone reductase